MFSRVAPSIYASDLDRAIRFYTELLGFAFDNVDDPPRRAVVACPAAVLHLDLDAARAGSSRTHMLTDDLDGVCDRLQRAGAAIVQLPTAQPWGLREMIVTDRDGNTLELAEPIHRPAAPEHG